MAKLPKYVCYSVKTSETGNTCVLECFGQNLSKRQAKKILSTLISWWGEVTKPGREYVGPADIFPTIKKFVDEGTLTLEECKEMALKKCSEYVWGYELEKIS